MRTPLTFLPIHPIGRHARKIRHAAAAPHASNIPAIPQAQRETRCAACPLHELSPLLSTHSPLRAGLASNDVTGVGKWHLAHCGVTIVHCPWAKARRAHARTSAVMSVTILQFRTATYTRPISTLYTLYCLRKDGIGVGCLCRDPLPRSSLCTFFLRV